MKKREKQENAITLVALVITIILLLILAGISIQALTNQGLFGQAENARKETKRAQVTEWLNLKLIEVQMNNPTATEEEIIDKTRLASEGNTELAKMGKNVVVDENVRKVEEGQPVDVYFYIKVDKDMFKVEMTGVKFIRETEELPPFVSLENYSINSGAIYATLEQAVQNATVGDEIKVISNYTDTSDVIINKNLKINTNGKTLTRTKTIEIANGTTVEITGSGTLTTAEEINLITNNGTLKGTAAGYSGAMNIRSGYTVNTTKEGNYYVTTLR